MRIKAFSKLVKEHLTTCNLETTEVIVDGQNLYYKLYKESGLNFILGSECSEFAKYIKEHLSIFKKANLKCNVIVKGGHDSEELLKVHINRKQIELHGKHYVLGENYDGSIIMPRLAKDIYLEVLEELGFDYTISAATDVTKVCFDLAQQLRCPVISFNIQNCFSPATYIPFDEDTKFELKPDGTVKCKIFKRDNFLQYYNISEKKLILFILLTDTHIFEENFFDPFFNACMNEMSNTPIKRYKRLLSWLSHQSIQNILREVCKFLSESDKQKFLNSKNELEKKFLICNNEESITSLYFTNKNKLKFENKDPQWFEKGITLKYISVPYINLHYWGFVTASRLVEDYDQENTVLFSKDIIKYAYDLLQNFNGKNIYIKYVVDNGDQLVIDAQTVCKPEYVADKCVFENGWEDVNCKGLFEHFFKETLGSFNFSVLEAGPADIRLLLLSLVYFKRNKVDDVSCLIYSVIVSYVLFGVVAEKENEMEPLLDTALNRSLVTERDCRVANTILKTYRSVTDAELRYIFDRTKLHTLLQFENCLQQINYLNKLCGSPYVPTKYSKTFNGTFIYKLLRKIDGENAIQRIAEILSPAPSVSAFVSEIIELYEKLLYGY